MSAVVPKRIDWLVSQGVSGLEVFKSLLAQSEETPLPCRAFTIVHPIAAEEFRQPWVAEHPSPLMAVAGDEPRGIATDRPQVPRTPHLAGDLGDVLEGERS
ncbi:hypothetical protein, partial [Mycolicibacterium fortuitum]|uniref:hypothetical protein n=1 Tax=Mycolicibacterium fortuitum TaxID=1766 RepID=UPI001A95B7D0